MNILFIKNNDSKIEYSEAMYLEKVVDKANLNVIQLSLDKKQLFSFFKNLRLLKKAIKNSNVQLIHCFNIYATILAILCFSRKKIVLSFFEKNIPKTKFFQQLILKFCLNQIILENKKCEDFIGKKMSNFILPEKPNQYEFYPLKKDFCKDMLCLSKEEDIILYITDFEKDQNNLDLVQNAISNINEKKYKLIKYHHDIYHIKNHQFNCAEIIITHLNQPKKIIEELLLTNKPIIVLEKNEEIETYSHYENIHFSDKERVNLSQTITSVLLEKNYDSRTQLLEEKENLILQQLLYIYKMNYIWRF